MSAESDTGEASRGAAGSARPLVWLVEDSALEQQMASRVLSPFCDVELLSDGPAMLERLGARADVDTVVLDWQLPGMSGIELCQFLRSRHDALTLPILILTARTEKEEVVRGLAAGANDYVTKPYHGAELLARVRSLASTRQLHRRALEAERRLSLERDELERLARENALLAERSRAAEERAERERIRLHSILFHAPALIHVQRGPDLVFEFVHPLTSQLFGPSALVGRSAADVAPDAVVPQLLERAAEVLRTGRPYVGHEVPAPIDRGDGRRRTATFNFVQQPIDVDADGTIDGVVTFAYDVTEQVESRDRAESLAVDLATQRRWLSAVLRQLPSAVMVVDGGGKVVLANERAAALFALEPGPGGQPGDMAAAWGDRLLHPDGRPLAPGERPVDRSLLRGEDVVQEELLLSRRPHDPLIVAVTSTPLRDEAGAIVAAVAVYQDITEKKAIEEFQQQLVGIVSHDLRGPLSAVMSGAELLRDPRYRDEEKRTRAATRILSSAERMERIVTDLLDYTHVRARGSIPIEPRPCDVDAICAAVLDDVRMARPDRTIAYHPGSDGGGQWDAGRLAQVLHNLIGNALKYGAPSTPVTVTWSRPGGVDLLIEVHNEGAPIAPDLLPHLFEPFRRGRQSGEAQRSLGLGLFIVKRIVDAHGGRITVASDEAAGTTFSVSLPPRAPAPRRDTR